MTTSADEVTLATIADRLDGLTDLFRRRLLEDRAKNSMLDSLQSKLERAERIQSAEALRPLVTRVAMVIERLQSAPSTEDLRYSIIEELEDLLHLFGVTPIEAVEDVDPRRHEIVSVTGDGTRLRVGELVRAGYEKDGVVLRPARITAIRVGAGRPDADDDWVGDA